MTKARPRSRLDHDSHGAVWVLPFVYAAQACTHGRSPCLLCVAIHRTQNDYPWHGRPPYVPCTLPNNVAHTGGLCTMRGDAYSNPRSSEQTIVYPEQARGQGLLHGQAHASWPKSSINSWILTRSSWLTVGFVWMRARSMSSCNVEGGGGAAAGRAETRQQYGPEGRRWGRSETGRLLGSQQAHRCYHRANRVPHAPWRPVARAASPGPLSSSPSPPPRACLASRGSTSRPA